MLGQAVVWEARRRGWPALGLSRLQGDVQDRPGLEHWMESFRPELVVNCAAFTKVDACEAEEQQARAVNGAAVGNVVRAAAAAGAALVQISTDYVFDGAVPEKSQRRPYREDDTPSPASAYGRSKLLGESQALAYEESLVVRVSWLFGAGGPNFVATMLRLVNGGHRTLRVVDDQVGGPTYTPFLARALCELAAKKTRGIVHYQNREPVSWYGFTREIVRQWSPAVDVEPVSTGEFPRPAPRPAYSVLDVARCEEILGRRVETWSAGLAHYLAQYPGLIAGPIPGPIPGPGAAS